jgi:hypothetical protein
MKPEFKTWTHENLAKLAAEAHQRVRDMEVANEQLRSDLRDAMELLRQASKNGS